MLTQFQLSWELKLSELRRLSWAACGRGPSKGIGWDCVLVGCPLCGSTLVLPPNPPLTCPESERSHRVSPTRDKAKGPRRKLNFTGAHHWLNPKSPKRQKLFFLVICAYQEGLNSVTNFSCSDCAFWSTGNIEYRILILCISELPLCVFFPSGISTKTHLIKRNLQSFRRSFKVVSWKEFSSR